MPIETVAGLLDELEKTTLLNAEQIAILRHEQPRFRDPKELAKAIVLEYGWLTRYQVVHAIRGTASELFFENFLLLELIGQGGMGQVFKALHRQLQKIVAIKVIRPERLSTHSAARRFRREVKALSRLSHENVVLAYDAHEWNGSHFIVMEHVDGIDLARWVKQYGPLPVHQAAECIRDAARGLHHAHLQGLIHRDVKPSNLLYCPTTQSTKILDLGLAFFHKQAAEDTSMTSLTQEGAIVGTVDFISPEQATNSRSVDSRSDLYSLGCTFYFLLTGRVPFPDMETLEKLLKHKLEEPTTIEFLRDDVPTEISMIVRRLMAKRPEDRYQSAIELAAVLDGWLRATQSGELQAFTPPVSTRAPSDFSSSNDTVTGSRDFANLMDEVTNDSLMPGPQRGQPVIRSGCVFAAILACMMLIALTVVALIWFFPKEKRSTLARPLPEVASLRVPSRLRMMYSDHSSPAELRDLWASVISSPSRA